MTPEDQQIIMDRRKEHQKIHREILMQVYEIVENHEEEIDQLLEPIEEGIPDWMSEMREIYSESGDMNNRGYRRGQNGPNGRRGFGGPGNLSGPGEGRGYGNFDGPRAFNGGRGSKGPGGFGGPGRYGRLGFNIPLHPEMFVLLDPESLDELLNNDFSMLPTISPNPTNGMVRINIELNDNEDVSINLYDRQGNKIRNLMDKNLGKGDHELIFDISDISQGLYFYHISYADKVQKGRILIE
jgi:hypothetical protein